MAAVNGDSTPQSRVPAWKRLGLKLKPQGGAAAGDAAQAEGAPSTNGRGEGGSHEGYLNSFSPRQQGGSRSFDSGTDARKRRRGADAAGDLTPGKRVKHESTPRGAGDPFTSARSFKSAVRDPWGNGSQEVPSTSEQPIRPRRVIFSPEPPSTQHTETSATAATPTSTPPAQPAVQAPTEKEGSKKRKKKSKSTLLKSDGSPPADSTGAAESGKGLVTPKTKSKTVTFTPDTKTIDGDSASRFFKGWVSQQGLGGGHEEPTSAEEEAGAVQPVPNRSPAEAKEAKKAKKDKKEKARSANSSPEDPKERWVFVRYLDTYANDPENWKFNKSQQTDLLKNAFNLWRVPPKYDEALKRYIAGLQGKGIQDRLRESAKTALAEANAAIEQARTAHPELADMANDYIEKAREDALKDRVVKEKKRRREEAEANYFESEEFHRLVAKRRRAEVVLDTLGDAPTLPTPPPSTAPSFSSTISGQSGSEPARRSRKRKQRTGVPDDDDASDSDTEVSVPSPASASDSPEVSSSSEDPSSDSDTSDSDGDDGDSDDGDSDSDSGSSDSSDSSDSGDSTGSGSVKYPYPGRYDSD